jgi:hypothetical protein
VVRACAANLNFNYICLEQQGPKLVLKKKTRTARTAFGILPGRSHSGEKIGILRSVPAEDPDPAHPHPTVEWVLKCLAVTDGAGYNQVCDQLESLTALTQSQERVEEITKTIGATRYVTDRHTMVTLKLNDDRRECLRDYDLILTAGPDNSPDELPDGFFKDRQRNSVTTGHLTYYLNHDKMSAAGSLGFRILARPDSGLAHYTAAELHADVSHIDTLLRPNETTLIEVTLTRSVDSNVFRMTSRLDPASFGREPSGRLLPAA